MPRIPVIVLVALLTPTAHAADRATIIELNGRDLQQTLDAAPPHSTILCDPSHQLTIPTPITITKPLTLKGLCAKLPEKLGKSPLLIVKSKGVTITDFNLTGNIDSVPQSDRAPLIVIAAGEFRVENGRLANSSKDGINIDGSFLGPTAGDIVGGVVRDITATNCARDVVSISGSGGTGQKIKNVLVDNIAAYTSSHRGCVEVSDGAEHITVRKIYAQDCVYAVDIQDHGQTGQTDRHVVIQDVYALRCKHAVRTANKPLGHAHITLRDITAQECESPLRLTNIDNLTLTGVRILDHKAADATPLSIKNCNNLTVRDVTIENTTHKGPAVVIENCDGALIDGVTLRGQAENLTSALTYRLTADKPFTGLRITNVAAPKLPTPGIVLERKDDKALLSEYVITNNLTRVADTIQGPRGIVVNNLP